MDALATIAVEIQATLTGILVIMLIVILQILDLRGAKQNHQQYLQELSRYARTGENKPAFTKNKYRLISPFSIFLQFVFGIIVFAAFLCWGLYLLSVGLNASAILSGITALAGITMPFVVWFTSRRKNKEMVDRIRDVESNLKAKTEPKVSPEIKIPEPVTEKTEFAPEPVVSAEPVAKVVTAPEPEAVVKVPVETKAFGSPDWLPEDSILRRHYLSHLQTVKACKATSLPPRPTDSMLRRHYDSMMAGLQQPAAQTMPAEETKPMTAAAVGISPIAKAPTIPEDSMLKRHFLSQLQGRIEAELPTEPTDSMLKRHFANWKVWVIENEMLKLLKGMQS